MNDHGMGDNIYLYKEQKLGGKMKKNGEGGWFSAKPESERGRAESEGEGEGGESEVWVMSENDHVFACFYGI